MCRFLYALLAVTAGAFAGAIALIGVSFYWFNPAGVSDCGFNVFVMTVTVFLTLAVSLGSLHPQVTHSAAHWLSGPCVSGHCATCCIFAGRFLLRCCMPAALATQDSLNYTSV